MDYKRSTRDWQQTLVYSHDEATNSTRVSLVAGSELLSGIKDGIVDAMKDIKVEVNTATPVAPQEIRVIELPQIIKQTEIKEVPVVVVESQIKEVQVPVIVKEIEIKEIEKLVITTDFQIIEKPVIIERVIEKDNNAFLNKILIAQSIGLFLLGLILLLKR